MKLQSAVLLYAGLCLASPAVGTEEKHYRPSKRIPYRVSQDRANAVKEAFLFAWDGYSRFAFPNDELYPVTNTFGNSRNGWGATAIDALSTALIMRLDGVVKQIVDFVPSINFSRTNDAVSVFETTIRYLGGLVSGYDLLNGPFSNSPIAPQRGALLQQAINLAELLSPAFNTPSGIPDNIINITTGALATGDQSTGLAVAGTLVLEWKRLSDITGNPKYGALVERAEQYLLQPNYEPPLREPFPGLQGSSINYTTGRFTDTYGGWVGGADSFYEYLIKMWVYDSDRYASYRDRWIAAVDSSISYLRSRPNSRPELVFMASYDGPTLLYQSEHLACFDGGNILLGGVILDRPDYVQFGLELTAGCRATYTGDIAQIGPEVFGWLPSTCPTTSAPVPKPAGVPGAVVPGVAGRSAVSHVPDRLIVKQGSDPETPSAACASPDCKGPDAKIANVAVNRAAAALGAAPTGCTIPDKEANQAAFYAQSGFFVQADSYNLRPEVVESYYYAYRYTGDTKYQEWAWEAFVAINRTSRINSGFSAFEGVNSPTLAYSNFQESFFFAETLKYLYMIHAEDGPWQVNYQGDNQMVYNTEAHPVMVRKPLGRSRTSNNVQSALESGLIGNNI